MKLTVDRDALFSALAHVKGATRSSSIPILGNLLIEAGTGRLGIRATDLDIDISESVSADVSTQGMTTVPASTLHDIVKKLAGTAVSIELIENKLIVKSGRSRFTLLTLSPDEYPNLVIGDIQNSFLISGKDLRDLIKKTFFAISKEEARYYLNGIYLHVLGSELLAVTTDGHKLAKFALAMPDGANGMPDIIVPRKTVEQVRRLITDEDAMVKIEVRGGMIRFMIGDVTLTSKLIDGTYPDYDRVIPKTNGKELVLERAEFASAVDRVSTVADGPFAAKMNMADSKLSISLNAREAGSATEELEAQYRGDPLEIGFNVRYLSQVAEHIDGDSLTVEMSEPGSPAIFRRSDGAGALYILMPMRI